MKSKRQVEGFLDKTHQNHNAGPRRHVDGVRLGAVHQAQIPVKTTTEVMDLRGYSPMSLG